MGVFHVFEIVKIVTNRAKHFIFREPLKCQIHYMELLNSWRSKMHSDQHFLYILCYNNIWSWQVFFKVFRASYDFIHGIFSMSWFSGNQNQINFHLFCICSWKVNITCISICLAGLLLMICKVLISFNASQGCPCSLCFVRCTIW